MRDHTPFSEGSKVAVISVHNNGILILWYVRFYLEAIGGACRVEGRGFEPRCGTFFPPFLIFFFSFPFFSLSFFFFSPGFLFFLLLSIIPFKLAPPLQCSSIFLVTIECMPMSGMCKCDPIYARACSIPCGRDWAGHE